MESTSNPCISIGNTDIMNRVAHPTFSVIQPGSMISSKRSGGPSSAKKKAKSPKVDHETIRQKFVDYGWKHMQNTVCWKKKWEQADDGEGDIPLFVVPGRNCKESEEAVGEAFFRGTDSMIEHLNLYPFLMDNWDDLWPQLESIGWKELTDQHPMNLSRMKGLSKGQMWRYGIGRAETMTPGCTVFRSHISVMMLVARYPYFLLSDEKLIENLQSYGIKHGWMPSGPEGHLYNLWTNMREGHYKLDMKRIRRLLLLDDHACEKIIGKSVNIKRDTIM